MIDFYLDLCHHLPFDPVLGLDWVLYFTSHHPRPRQRSPCYFQHPRNIFMRGAGRIIKMASDVVRDGVFGKYVPN